MAVLVDFKIADFRVFVGATSFLLKTMRAGTMEIILMRGLGELKALAIGLARPLNRHQGNLGSVIALMRGVELARG